MSSPYGPLQGVHDTLMSFPRRVIGGVKAIAEPLEDGVSGIERMLGLTPPNVLPGYRPPDAGTGVNAGQDASEGESLLGGIINGLRHRAVPKP